MRALLPALAVLWGSAIVLRTLVMGTNGTGAYAGGQVFGALLGVGLIVLGGRQLLNARRST